MKMHVFALLVVCLVLALAGQTGAATVVSFPASDYNSNTAAMNQTLGITGYTFEDFGSTTLIPGLSIELSGVGQGGSETLTSLPQLYSPGSDSVLGKSLASNLWAGTYAFNNTPNNAPSDAGPTALATPTTFSFAGGVSSVGIGLANFQSLSSPEFPATNHTLYINGVAQSGTLESIVGSNWTPGIYGLNAYLRIDAAPGQTIDSIGFGNISGPDFLVFSHMAVFSSVPEPSSLILLSTASTIALGLVRCRRVVGRREHR